MGRLTNTAQEAFDKTRRRGEVPWWLPRLGAGLGVVLVLWIVVAGGPAPQESAGPRGALPSVELPPTVPDAQKDPARARQEAAAELWRKSQGADTETATGDPSGSTDGGQDEGGDRPAAAAATEFDSVDGTKVQVANAAYEVAQVEAVVRGGGTATLLGALVESSGRGTVTFRFTVDPDDSGPAAPLPVSVTVEQQGTDWRAGPA